MFDASTTLRDAHRRLVAHAFYPLLLSTGLAVAVLAARIYATRSTQFAFLVWNLFLAWIPYVLSLVAVGVAPKMRKARVVLLAPLFAAWLLFFPNAFYVVTDLVHLMPRGHVPLWFDIGLLATTAWTGTFLATTSLRAMHGIVHARFGWALGWCFAISCLCLGALGIFLGRFWRWSPSFQLRRPLGRRGWNRPASVPPRHVDANSWDMLLRPQARVFELGSLFVHPFRHLSGWAFIALFSAFSFVCYVTLRGAPRSTDS